MSKYLNSSNFPCSSPTEADILATDLAQLLENDFTDDMYTLLARYQRILADNSRRSQWPDIHNKLGILFKCGSYQVVDGPMIGIPVSIRDSDYFKDTVQKVGRERSVIAGIEWMATAWNMTFADTGLWMGKTFEPVSREVVAAKTENNTEMLDLYNDASTRIGRNFFREPADPDIIQGLGLPVLTPLWNLLPRPVSGQKTLFDADLLEENLKREQNIPYSMTGGIFLANRGRSVVPEMNAKEVYQLNYRWPLLNPVFPMTRLVDELVQIEEGIYLGQLVFASRHYSLGKLSLPFLKGKTIALGEAYTADSTVDYGYQNNGYFLMMSPDRAKQVYADSAFPQLRPRVGENGYVELGYDSLATDTSPATAAKSTEQWNDRQDWVDGWQENSDLQAKFSSFLLEDSPKDSDTEDVREMRRDNESILQMLQRISSEISKQTREDDHLRHFEKLHRLFRCGVAPEVKNGVFQGHGSRGYNCRVNGSKERDWYGQADVAHGWDYYHGANLNLHLGIADTLRLDIEQKLDDCHLFPAVLAGELVDDERGSNILDMIWHSIGKHIFPWAGKSFETISGRKLSMLLDESSDLATRYPERVRELKLHLASRPHYELVKKASRGYWQESGLSAAHLQDGSWDKGMSEQDKNWWEQEARDHWVDGCNIQDKRILMADPLFRVIDMNYRSPDPALQKISEAGPSPFARQGYIFLGTSGRDSILPMNNGLEKKKKVFQFHYRYPMVGGPAPIGLCLDELVEIADGLFLGQLIYSTALGVSYHSSIDPSQYKYQLFGYFLLLDDAWEYHRQAIGLDTV